MARIRTIKPEFFTSEEVVDMPMHVRLLYIALWCEADREGRLVWKPRTFKMRYFPADNFDMVEACECLVSTGHVVLYGDGLAYIPTFSTHQHVNPRESKSLLPAPPGWEEEEETGAVRGDLRAQILERDGHKCTRCGSSDSLEIDHIWPQSSGGTNDPENLRVLCKPCNAGRPVAGDALEEDLRKDGFDFDALKSRYSRVPTRHDASNLDMHAQVGRERKGRNRDASEHDAAGRASPTRSASRFAEFWLAWPPGPRKQAKSECEKKWKSRGLDSVADQILDHVRAISQTQQFREFTPGPLTYLNQRRWEDGTPSGGGAPGSGQAQDPLFRGCI